MSSSLIGSFIEVPEKSPMDLMAKRAMAAYHPYQQACQGEALDLSKSLLIEDLDKITRRHSIMKPNQENILYFNGTTGVSSYQQTTCFGFVEYKPSDLELALRNNPSLSKAEQAKFSAHRQIIVSFRGTQSGCDWATNLNAQATYVQNSDLPGTQVGGYVHTGFKKAFDSTRPEVERAIKLFMYERIAELPGLDHEVFSRLMRDTEVKVTGHSLGGALAHLCGDWLADRPDLAPTKPTVTTFAQPRVASEAFVANSDLKGMAHTRVVRKGDLVPQVPLNGNYGIHGGYVHGGEATYLTAIENGGILDQHDMNAYAAEIAGLRKPSKTVIQKPQGLLSTAVKQSGTSSWFGSLRSRVSKWFRG